MTAIGWINCGGPSGTWGHPAELALPADARGLLLGEGVFETVLVENGQARLLAAHLQRWQAGANVLALATPPGPAQIVPLVQQAVEPPRLHRLLHRHPAVSVRRLKRTHRRSLTPPPRWPLTTSTSRPRARSRSS